MYSLCYFGSYELFFFWGNYIIRYLICYEIFMLSYGIYRFVKNESDLEMYIKDWDCVYDVG